MKPYFSPGRLLSWFGLLSVFPTSPLFAAEAHPPAPALTGIGVISNTQHKVSWTPYPAADAYNILSTPDLTQPFGLDLSGAVLGYDWTAPLNGTGAFYKLQVIPMAPNDLFSATVLNRLTYGPTPDEIERIKSIGPDAYIAEQMASQAILDTIDIDPAITNTAPPLPPPPPLTNWIRISATGTTSGTRTNVLLYLNGSGRVYVDDIRVVLGNAADTGTNLLTNGDFEEGSTLSGWNALAPFGGSYITNSPTVDGISASGTNCLLLIGSAGGSGLSDSFWAPFATNTAYPVNQQFTLSFSYLPVVQSATNRVLTVRLAGGQTIRDIGLPASAKIPPPPPPAPPAIASTYARLTNGNASLDDLRAYQTYRAIHGKRQLHEVLSQFFQNHFTTQYQKTKDWFDNNYSNAITNDNARQLASVSLHWREHDRFRTLLLNPDCTFYDLLKASIESPAMIIYLDTVLNSKNAPNQNYAREVLELHSMGADNGYLQQDIVDLARVWTGWRVVKKDPSVAGNPFAPAVTDATNMPGLFSLHYATNSHDVGTKRLFTNSVIDPRFGSFRGGQSYSLILSNTQAAGTNGFAEGYKVIQHLAELPYTMEFLSVKLCQLFVHEGFEYGTYNYAQADLTPEAQLVKDCMTAWDTTGGDNRKGNIRLVLNTIFSSALFRGHGASQQKIKTPLELAVSAVRALRISNLDTNGYVTSTADSDGYGISGSGGNNSPLGRMGGMGLFNKAEPDGFSESGKIWMNTANLCERMRFAEHLLMPTTGNTLKSTDYGNPGLKNTSDPVGLLRLKLPAASWYDAPAVVDYFLGLLYLGEGKANLSLDRQAAIEFLNANDSGQLNSSLFASLVANPTSYDARVRSMVGFLMSLPRFQEQ